MRTFDSHVKAVDGVQERTMVGGVITLSGLAIMLMLLLYEFLLSSPELEHHMSVDSPGGSAQDAKVDIRLHITFPHLACDGVNLDFEATRGDAAFDPVSEIKKRDAGDGGCSFQGHIVVAKVGGTLKFGVKGHDSLLQIGGFLLNAPNFMSGEKAPNISHVVHELAFGRKERGMTNPLDGVTNALTDGLGQYQYTIKVIPTVYRHLARKPVSTHQYSIAEQFVKLDGFAFNTLASSPPGVHFYYDFYPVAVEYWEESRGFLETITSLCAIIGGIFVISSIVDGCAHSSIRSLSGKAH